jgi:16S rRNA (uracil1498-N3)-methyltransferase
VLQKCTEVGVSRFVPVVTERSVAHEPSASRQQRFESIVREAAEQSGRGIVPEVSEPSTFVQALHLAVEDGSAYLCWEAEREQRFPAIVSAPRWAGLFIGPEGGFSEEEVRAAAKMGVQPLSLGARILRSETAAIVGAALLLDRLDHC